jgi:RNA polymerase sigma-70 factor (ECF subfamily)
LAYREGVGWTPAQSAASTLPEASAAWAGLLDGALLNELWLASDADTCGLTRDEFHEMLTAESAHLAATEAPPNRKSLVEHFRNLRLADLTLARACAQGCERAWERFLVLYRQPLIRAAIAITGSDSLGRELADQLYGELYGLTERDGVRRCPLASYRGRGSLLGWLRTTLAQRHVDHHRRTHREESLDDGARALDPPAAEPEPLAPPAQLDVLQAAVGQSLTALDAEDRFLLAAYYLDGRKLHQIGAVLGTHEATISRKLKRAAETVHKLILKNLEAVGMSRRAAQEALGTDPRDLDVNLKTLLQALESGPFPEQAERQQATG